MTKLEIKNFNILYDKVFVKGIQIDSNDGVYRPTQYNDAPELGTIVKIGDGRMLDNGEVIPLKVKIDDTVYFNKYSTTKFHINGEDFYVLREEDIVAYVR